MHLSCSRFSSNPNQRRQKCFIALIIFRKLNRYHPSIIFNEIRTFKLKFAHCQRYQIHPAFSFGWKWATIVEVLFNTKYNQCLLNDVSIFLRLFNQSHCSISKAENPTFVEMIKRVQAKARKDLSGVEKWLTSISSLLPCPSPPPIPHREWRIIVYSLKVWSAK